MNVIQIEKTNQINCSVTLIISSQFQRISQCLVKLTILCELKNRHQRNHNRHQTKRTEPCSCPYLDRRASLRPSRRRRPIHPIHRRLQLHNTRSNHRTQIPRRIHYATSQSSASNRRITHALRNHSQTLNRKTQALTTQCSQSGLPTDGGAV